MHLFGELTDADHLEAMESLEEWGVEPVAVDHKPLITDEEILESVGASYLASRRHPDDVATSLEPHQEVEDFL